MMPLAVCRRSVGMLALAALMAGLGPWGRAHGDEPTPPAGSTAMPATASPAADDGFARLEKQLQEEMKRLERLQEQLKVIQATPPPAPAPPAPRKEAPGPSVQEVPEGPVPGAEEAFANTLYALGQYRKARDMYRRLAQEGGSEDRTAWALLQAGHCARRMGDNLAANEAYEECMNRFPKSPWAKEAAWWSGHVKWLTLLREAMGQESGPPTAPREEE